MLLFEHALLVTLLAPFFGGVFSILFPARRQGYVALLFIPIIVWAVASIVHHNLINPAAFRYEIGNWGAPLGIGLYIDGLSTIMLALVSVIGVAVATYASGYFASEGGKVTLGARGFWPILFLLWGALNTLFMVADLFTFYVCLELITLAAVALIALARELKALKAALRYLMTALMGSLLYMLGVGFVYAQTGVLDWTLASQMIGEGNPALWMALALLTAGLCIKTALFPQHFWLPGAHSIAPPPVSALLSALVIKASFYVLLRLWAQVFPDAIHPMAAHLLGLMGAGAVIWGSFQAILQRKLKIMVAYSTVAQVGYLFLAFPLMASLDANASSETRIAVWNGLIYFVLSHAVAKAAMFLVAGIFIRYTGSENVKDLQGVAVKLPVPTLVWGLVGVSIIGLPPSGGFIAKWQLLTSSIHLGQWFYAAVILFGGLLASVYVFQVLWYAFFSGESAATTHKKIPIVMSLSALFLAVIIFVMGVWTSEIFSIIRIASPFIKPELLP